MTRRVAFVVLISLAAFAVTYSSAENSKSDLDVISAYVISYKHWPAKVFRIERAECDCAYALYRIIYLPEDGRLPAPNSKSFAVHYDEQRHKIVKETHFQ